MSVRPIRLYGDPVLTSLCDPIKSFDEKASALIADLLDTTSEPGRAGVAANQIGVALRAFSFNVDSRKGYLINPENLECFGEPELVDEGCLSIPGQWHQVMRFPEAKLSGYQLDGKLITVHGHGVLAQALQHELDHLNGYLYIDRLSPEARKEAMSQLRNSDWFLN